MRLDPHLSSMILAAQERSYTAAAQPIITPPPAKPAETNEPSPSTQALTVTTAPRTEPRDIVEFQGIEIDLDPATPPQADSNTATPINSRALSPRDMADFSLDLYIDGAISFDEYSMMAFQAELHPDFDQTIGTLTGEQANPDQPRDYIQDWEDRYSFERRYPSDSPKTLERIERILTVLQNFQAPLDHVA